MILCPSCGTRNRRGSKYCYRCGQRLDIVFDVSCPACDRLNPGGSAFCAFCGAKIPGSLPPAEPAIAEQPAVAVPPMPVAQQSLETQPESVEPAPRSPRELPPWLYEEAVTQPETAVMPAEVPFPPAVQPPLEQSKYLSDIPGALPKTEGWLSSIPKPAADQAPQSKPKAQGGCLTLVIPFLLGVAALVLL